MSGSKGDLVRLRVYLGEDKLHGGQPLYRAILAKARQSGLAGATVTRGVEGFGRSTRMHSCEVLASEDLPVVIEIIDVDVRIAAFRDILLKLADVGLVTCDPILAAWTPPEP